MEMKFPKDYPMNPPFVRVIRPRFKFLTGLCVAVLVCIKKVCLHHRTQKYCMTNCEHFLSTEIVHVHRN